MSSRDPEIIATVGPLVLTAQIEVTKHPIDLKIAELHKEATRNKESNWDAAVACLQEAAQLMRERGGNYAIDRWTRLPVFLQQAGRYEEAMQEFQRLLDEVKPRVAKETELVTLPSVRRKQVHLNFVHIYDKIRMVCKREKLLDKALEYKELAEKHQIIVDELSALLEIERDAERMAYLERREHKRL
jgi:tetratricopeptide (TPR) repeat protein